ncbi:MAG: ABC transporter substrate-binding protein [Candidatus Dormibacteria bacterium]
MLKGRKTLTTILGIAAVAVSAGCGQPAGSGPTFDGNVTIVLNQPSSKLPWLGNITGQGAQLAADQVNAAGGVRVGGKTYRINLQALDNRLSPSTAVDNVKKAAAEKAVAIIDDGYTSDATYAAARDAGIPLLINFDGNTTLIDVDKRPGVFRIAPPNDAVAGKLVNYIVPKGLKLAVVHDDSEYGKDGDAQLSGLLAKQKLTPLDLELPSSAADYPTQALQVKQSGATGVIVWARSPVIAAFVKSLRQGGASAAVFAGPTAEDPIVRTQLADHPDWVEGITYASFRITTEGGPDAWNKFRGAYEAAKLNGGEVDYHVGVKARDKKDVVQPPDWQVFTYDMVYLVKAAIEKAGTVDPTGGKIINALNDVQIRSANGDNRGWKKDNHEGVVDDDIIFNTFIDMKFKPVQDDPLSKSLPPIDQE